MKARRAASAVVLGAAFACAQAEAPADLRAVLPDAEFTRGWQVAEGPTELDRDTLYEYLDGGASLYLDYGFRHLVHVRYQHGEELLASVTLDVFDMGNDLGAFGIYSSGRSPESLPRDWGAEGYRLGTIAASWKGSYFVHGEADDEGTELIETLDLLMTLVSDTIEGRSSPPAVIGLLPSENRVPRSERWVAEDLLGYDFLPGGVLATYELNGRTAQLFFSELGTPPSAEAAFVRLRTHQAQRGTIAEEIGSIGDAGFRYSDPVLGEGSVVRAGRYLAGAYGELDYSAQERLLTSLVSRLESPIPED